ncbi:MAG: aminomethyl-transferring glycine dehydrogenase subunit GcvPB, partial [Alphaproteobacteria bacterium]|nr:aminomethyl-transferring glycine dehydrogenase subunit GcvPB [Alphaproteobacteria bacterium]
MTDFSQGRTNVPMGGSQAPGAQTVSGSRGLEFAEPLIFEMHHEGRTGADLPDVPVSDARLNGMRRQGPVGLPGLSEPQVVRHYTRLSQKNYGIDSGFY